MKEIYVVMGSTGVYEDRREWMVQAYENKDLATAHVGKAKARADEIHKQACIKDRNGDDDYFHFYNTIETEKNQYDPDGTMDTNGNHYRVGVIDLIS